MNYMTSPSVATTDELNKDRMFLEAYRRSIRGKKLSTPQRMSLEEIADTVKKIDQTSALNNTYEAVYGAGPRNLPNSNYVKEAKAKKAFLNRAPSDQERIMLSSLMKDTPEGNYENTLAKLRAESDITQNNYTNAFNSLRQKAETGFENMLDVNPDLQNPDMIDEAQKNYRILSNFAPALAIDPVVAGSFVKKTISYGGIDENQISNLVKTNNDAMKHYSMMRGGF